MVPKLYQEISIPHKNEHQYSNYVNSKCQPLLYIKYWFLNCKKLHNKIVLELIDSLDGIE